MRNVFAACIVSFGFAVVASAGDPPVVAIDFARVKSLALDACMQKCPGTDRNALQYSGLTVTSSTNDQIVVNVTYLLSGSGATTSTNAEKDGFETTMTKQATYVVQMDSLGGVEDVSTGSSINMQSRSSKKAANRPTAPTAKMLEQLDEKVHPDGVDQHIADYFEFNSIPPKQLSLGMPVAEVINILGEPTARYQTENGRVVFNSKTADVANWLDWQHKPEGVDVAPYIGARVKDGVIVDLKANRR